ncbi:hypothetical protein FJZ31_20830 [Candidatus Poribacteria bacterium]|nr:hypothetical protein [Candidatus Poribacteria bacterium]
MTTNFCLFLFCQAFATVPLRSKDKKMDVIAVDNASNCPTTDDDVGIPVAFADQVNLMMGNPILHGQPEEQPITQFTKFTLDPESSEGEGFTDAFPLTTFSGQVGLWEEIYERILKVKQRILKVEQKILEVERMTNF